MRWRGALRFCLLSRTKNQPKDDVLAPPPHRVSRALRARNPRRVRKESRKSTPGQGPKSPQRVRPGVSKEVEKSLKPDVSDSFETPGRTLWGLLGPWPGVPFPDSFRTLRGFRARRGRRCVGRGQSQPKMTFLGRMSHGHPGVTPADIPAKTSVRAVKILGKQTFRHGRP